MRKMLVQSMAAVGMVILTGAAAHAAPITFDVTFAPEPPVVSTGSGNGTVVFDPVAHTLAFNVSFQDLIGPTTASHIHCCTAAPLTGTAGVAVTAPSLPGFPLGVTAGAYSNTLDLTLVSSFSPAFVTNNGGTVASAEAALLAAALGGRAYLNIHTNFAPGGEIRGFLIARQVPEPASLLLVGAGLAAAAWRRRRGGIL